MIAEILCVGTELLLGNIVNTNATYLAQKCAEYGLSLYHQQVVGDNEERLAAAFAESLSRSDVIITSGGLGPTNDDLTKEIICRTLGLELYEDQEALAAMTGYFERMGRKQIDPINLKQALIPVGGKALINKNGTAPAVMIETNNTAAKDTYPDKTVFLLPGPPKELIPLVEEYLTPYFKKNSPESIYSMMLKLTGIGESQAAAQIDSILRNSTNPTVAPYAKMGEVHFRITAKAASEAEADALMHPVYEEIRSILGGHIFTTQENETLEEVVIRLAKEQGVKIATAESCTGGLLSGRLINVSGASDCFEEGLVTYSNEAKIRSLGVPEELLNTFGAVSEQCAAAMAEGAAKAAGADLAVATTGIAGPTGGTDEKPVGLVYIGIFFKGQTRAERYVFNGNRQIVREAAVARALNRMWKELISSLV